MSPVSDVRGYLATKYIHSINISLNLFHEWYIDDVMSVLVGI